MDGRYTDVPRQICALYGKRKLVTLRRLGVTCRAAEPRLVSKSLDFSTQGKTNWYVESKTVPTVNVIMYVTSCFF